VQAQIWHTKEQSKGESTQRSGRNVVDVANQLPVIQFGASEREKRFSATGVCLYIVAGRILPPKTRKAARVWHT
jgi:hypothetical protein